VALGWLPWTGDALGAVLAVYGLVGALLVFLAIIGRARWLLCLFALISLIAVTWGIFFTSWRFSGNEQARTAVHFVLGLTITFIGAIPMGAPKERRYRG
jgi:hypothetical protein